MKTWRHSIAVVTLALAVAPGGAAAKPSGHVPRVRDAQFAVAGTNGFHLQFDLSKRETTAIATHRSDIVFYITKRGRVNGDLFETVLPGIGAVVVRFYQHGETESVGSICRGVPKLVRNGVFVGKIRIHGERGYTEVDAEHVAGQVTETPARRCGPHRQRHKEQSVLDRAVMGESTEAESIAVTAQRGNLNFSTSEAPGAEELAFSTTTASHSRRHDGLMVLSGVSKFSQNAAFTLTETSPVPSVATVEPASPFSGSAKFELLGPHSSTWTGDLAVELPGVGPVQLTGKRFKSNLCVGEACEGSLPAAAFASIGVGAGRLR